MTSRRLSIGGTPARYQVPSLTGKVIRLHFEYETAGAIRYCQRDALGQPIKQHERDAVFPVLYLRKNAIQAVFGTDHVPMELTVNLSLD